jgi:hypothetical protein
MDIVLTPLYLRGRTSHVIAGKRNTSKGLQALIEGNYVVEYSFIEELIKVGKVDEGTQDTSLLEEDFGANWPKEIQHLPAPGKEPGNLAEKLFEPDRSRSSCFKDVAFLFFEKAQFENLQDVIKLGYGKPLHYELVPGRSTVDEITAFARNLTEKAIVVVRSKGLKDNEDWVAFITQGVVKSLDGKAIDQNEFLEAILRNDGKLFERPYDSLLLNSGKEYPDPL